MSGNFNSTEALSIVFFKSIAYFTCILFIMTLDSWTPLNRKSGGRKPVPEEEVSESTHFINVDITAVMFFF